MMTTLNEYQEEALTTADFPSEYAIIYPSLGLNGEAGEVAEKVKKIIRDKNGEICVDDKFEIAKELGDVLWYVAVLANSLDITLEEVATMNINKLRSRKQRNKIHGNGDNR